MCISDGTACIPRFICDQYFETCMGTLGNVVRIGQPWGTLESDVSMGSLEKRCEHNSSIQILSYTYVSSSCTQHDIIFCFIEIDHFLLENLGSTTFETESSYSQEYNIRLIRHFLMRSNMSYQRGRTLTS